MWVTENTAPGWTFLTNHAQVLVCIARDPGVRLREIGERVGITERAAHRIVVELADAGYITRARAERRRAARDRDRDPRVRAAGRSHENEPVIGGLLLAVGCALAGSVSVL